MLIALLAVVPALTAIVFLQVSERRRGRERILADNLRLVRVAAAQQAAVFDDARRLLMRIVEYPVANDGDRQRCHDALSGLRHAHGGYINLLIADSTGRVVCAATPSNMPSMATRAWFQRAVSSKKTAVGDYQLSAATGDPVIVVAHPLLSQDGDVRLVAAASIGLDQLTRLAAASDLVEDATLTLFDRKLIILARHPDADRWIGQRVPNSGLLDHFSAGAREDINESTGVDGIERLWVTVPVDASVDTGLYLGMGVAHDVAFADANRVLSQNVWLLAVVSLAALAAAVLGGHMFVVKPLRALKAVTERLASGDLTARAQLASGLDGLRELGDAVDAMAAALDRRQRERERAEQQVRLLARALESTNEMVSVTDAGNRIIFVNRAFLNTYGYTWDEVIGRTPEFLRTEAPPDVLDDIYAKSRRGGWQGELLNRRKDGSTLSISLNTSPIFDADGHLIGLLGVARDITNQRSLEEQLRQSQKMEAVGQLAGGIAHDFNNLLTAIHGYAELVADTLPDADERRSHVDEIRRGAERATRLTRQLLAFSRKQLLTLRPLHIGDVVAGIAPMLRRLLGETIVLKTIASDKGLAKADAAQFEQVLLNLAVNSRDAMPNGGTLTIETSDVCLEDVYARHHPSARPGPHVMLAVTDSGSGMDAETQKRVFEPFFTTKPTGKGTGLGLAMVYGIVTQSGGHIEIDSKEGVGTIVRIYLPQTQEAPPATETPAPETRALRGSETILLVEDEQIVRDYAAAVLTGLGYTVRAVADPREAILYAQAFTDPIEIILTDVVLPGMSGPAMAAHLRQSHPEAKVLYMSGYTDDAILRHGVSEGEMWFLQKPFSSHTLAKRLRELVESSPHAAVGRPSR